MMDFFTNPAKINMLRKILIVAFVAILLQNIYDVTTGLSDNYVNLAIPVIFILLMIYSIRRTNIAAHNNSDRKS